MKPALLVIDIQNEYLKIVPERDWEIGQFFINALIGLFREKGHPVYRVYHHDPKNGPEPGSEAFRFPETVLVRDDDPEVIKHHPSAFRDTELDGMLREAGIDTLFLTGLSAVGCVMATYWGACDRDYHVFMVRDAVMSHSTELTCKAMDITDSVSPNLVEFMLGQLSG
jgi:nicotinamidase-related amidase